MTTSRAGTPSTDQPTRIGEYLILDAIAEGGMGVIYRARHPSTGELVALKTVRAAGEAVLAGLRREIHALHKLRHPQVVRILAEGVFEGLPWYAMELLDGETLDEQNCRRWEQMPQRPAAANGALDEVLTLVRRLCDPLAFLHGEGIVHRDLKPKNIVFMNERPVLVDFGLAGLSAGALGREVADVWAVDGTPAYMAPEQISGQADARSDLYALGCIFYELVTGRPPFIGMASDVLRHHQRTKPRAPSELVTGVEPALDQLMLALLEKRPRDRIGHAEDVAQALEALGARGSDERPPTRVYVYRPALVGRERELDELGDRGAAARRGEGGCVLLGGESGIGKTFLALEAARQAVRDFRIVAGACAAPGTLPSHGGLTLQPFQPAIRAIVDQALARGSDVAARLLGARGATLSAWFPSVRELGLEPPRELNPTAPIHRERLFAALEETLIAFAREKPLYLLLDDLQWADELTRWFLSTRAPDWLAGTPLFIVGTFRTDEGAPLDGIVDRRDVLRLKLDRLDNDWVRSIACDMLGATDLPRDFAELVARRCEGNPFFVAEYVRAASAEGLIRRGASRTLTVGDAAALETLPLPATLRELIQRRLAGLTAEAQALVEWAAIVGHDVELPLLEAIEGEEAPSLEALGELEARQVLEPAPGDRMRFLHDKLREIAYQQIAPARRQALHGAVARALEARLRAVAQPSLHALIAYHFLEAGDEARAIEHGEKAAQHSLDTAAYAEAAAHFQRVIALDAKRAEGRLDSHRHAGWHHGLCKASFALGELDAFERHVHRLLALVGHPLPATRAGWLRLLLRELAIQVWHLSGGARPVEPGTPESLELREAAAAAGLAPMSYFFRDDALAMIASSLLSVNLAERVHLEGQVPRSYSMLGSASSLVRQKQLAFRYFERAQRGAAGMNDPSEQALALAIEFVCHANFGRWREAEACARRAEERLVGVRDPVMHEMVQTALGHVEYFTGRYQAALARYQAVLASATARGNLQHAIWGRFSAARSLHRLGRYDEALPLVEQATRELGGQPELQSEVIAHGLLAMARLRTGDEAGALASCDEVVRRISKAPPAGFPPLEGHLNVADVLDELRTRGTPKREIDRRERPLRLALWRFAAMFPVARPAAFLVEGRAQRARDRRRLARRLLARAERLAGAMEMPIERAAARRALDET